MTDSNNTPFPDIDPYQVLEVGESVSPAELRKSYRKLMLRYHPDKTKNWASEAKEKFHKIQFAFEVLENFKTVYDKTRSIEACFQGSDLASWKDLFDMDVVIDKDTIEQDKVKYRGSSDETQDIEESWRSNEQQEPAKKYVPDEDQFTLLFQEIPHVEANSDDEDYIYGRIGQLLDANVIEDRNGSYKRWTQNRKVYLAKLKRRLAKEAKLADEMLNSMQTDAKPRLKAGQDKNELRQLIQKKNKSSFDSLISRLEAQAKAKNKTKPRSKRSHAEIDDAEFEKLQAKIVKKKR
ncbi:LAME_0A07184g1_1 [Lachancea meyersii CBS 8951]|uniref:LAME_0A07184g1_1 n=1 Tax=Lachancea meyersii CBS 8951 TaxID=1266667 RepID=A0A1G4IQM9_9SACH|nr:LAME_0A07184g1_1 [Lachancea meyersii CBS 8951]